VLGKPPAFDAREMLANGVDLGDRGTAGKKRTRHRLLLSERKARSGRDPVCRCTAGNEHQHQIVAAGGIGQGERLGRRCKTRRVRHRVTGFDDANEAARAAVAETGDGETADAV
jgi:hypothetical protein